MVNFQLPGTSYREKYLKNWNHFHSHSGSGTLGAVAFDSQKWVRQLSWISPPSCQVVTSLEACWSLSTAELEILRMTWDTWLADDVDANQVHLKQCIRVDVTPNMLYLGGGYYLAGISDKNIISLTQQHGRQLLLEFATWPMNTIERRCYTSTSAETILMVNPSEPSNHFILP